LYSIETDMQDAEFLTLADRFHVPEPVARGLAVHVAQKCALLANRYEPEGALTAEQMSAVETLGSEIGAAIIAAFEGPTNQSEMFGANTTLEHD
jgi:hypothetical protein